MKLLRPSIVKYRNYRMRMINCTFLLLFMLVIPSCARGQDTNTLIVGKWQLINVDTGTNEQIVGPDGKKSTATYSKSQLIFKDQMLSTQSSIKPIPYYVRNDTLYTAKEKRYIVKVNSSELVLEREGVFGKVYYSYERIKEK